MRQSAAIILIVLTVLVAAVYLPTLYGKLFFSRVEKTHLLYSPVTQRFIYKEKIVGPAPPEAVQKSEDHHAEIAYRDENGTYYTRVEFEKRLPFIYYKNMELWGLLPLRLGGEEFEKKTIKQNRRVLELKSDEINYRQPRTHLWPLLESNPDQARLVFPEDRFRMTAGAMEFVNADNNTVDRELTERFTRALVEKGFEFPARSVNGKFTILKPFDEGVFLVDAAHSVFHVKRRNGEPLVIKTPIDPTLKTRHIKISENKRKRYYGLLLADDGGLHLLTYDNYRLDRLPLENYDPDRMDFKLVINPLYRTAVHSDEIMIRAVAMNRDLQPVARYEHRMSRATKTTARRVYEALFPFSLHLKQKGGGFLTMSVETGGLVSLLGLLIVLIGYTAWLGLRARRPPRAMELGVLILTGVYGLIALRIVDLEA